MLAPLGASAQTPEPEPTWVRGVDYRLKTSVFRSDEGIDHPILVVVLHGDAPFHNPDYQDAFAAKVTARTQDVVAVGLLRPGYTDPQGNTSEGKRGQANGDNWNAKNTDAIAEAIGTLKRRYHSRKVVVAGHSGGAAITANILGRPPQLIDAALLVSCPCDAERWRKHMFERTGNSVFQGEIDTLSPIEQVESLSDQVNVVMVVGRQDEVAPPDFSESYRAAASERGKSIRLVRLEGKGHEIFLASEVLAELASLLQ